MKMPCQRGRTTPVIASLALALLLGAGLPAAAQPAPPARPLVWVLSTGGTISGRGAASTSLAEYESGALTGADLVAAVPEIADVADVRVEQIANVSSTDITLAHWLTLANRINAIFDADPNAAGVVITHGTNTLEETAYFLNLTVKHDRPVVLVGSMRPASAISADGPLNLLNAIRTAASRDAVGKGVLVVLNDEVNGARDVTKTNTYRVETFRAPELGLMGYVDADTVAFYRGSLKRHTARSEFDVAGLTDLPAVDIVYSYVQPSTAMAAALVAAGVQGIVFAGTGAGLISARERDALKPFLAMPPETRPLLVRSNRTGNGRVVALAEYDAMGMIPADNAVERDRVPPVVAHADGLGSLDRAGFRLGRAHQHERVLQGEPLDRDHGSSTKIEPESTRTGYTGTLAPRPGKRHWPVRTSYIQPCHGQASRLPLSLPWLNGPPRWVHTSLHA
jgi:L-asparaginase